MRTKKIYLFLALLCTVLQGSGVMAQSSLSLSTTDGYYINMPQTGETTLNLDGNITTFKVFDNGGSSGDYSSNCEGILVLTAPTGYISQLTGTVNSEVNYDL